MSIALRHSGFRELYDEHYAFVWHTVRRFGVPAMLVEDAVQDTFVTAFRKHGDFDGRFVRAWLYNIGRRVASNHRRGRARAARRHQSAIEGSARPRPTEDLIVAKTLVDRFLATLSVADRELFVLSEVDGLTGPELAELSGRKLPTLYSRIRIVRRRFEAFMRERDEPGAAALEQARDGRPRADIAGWAAIVPRLGLGGSASLWTGGASGLTTYVVAGVVAVGVLLGVRMIAGDSATPSTRDVVADLALAPASPPSHGPGVEKPMPEADAPTVVAEVAVSETPTRPPRSSRARSRRPPTAVASTDLAADLQLLRTAGDSLHDGDAARALTQLETHAERFATSPQADLRAALRVEALCRLGRVADATKTANALLTARPTTPVATRIRSSCIMKTME